MVIDAPPGWINPIGAIVGDTQRSVDPTRLLPSRRELLRFRLEGQRTLIVSGRPRATPILVTRGGVIFDGHHAVRAAIEEGQVIEVLVTSGDLPASAGSVMDLPLR